MEVKKSPQSQPIIDLRKVISASPKNQITLHQPLKKSPHGTPKNYTQQRQGTQNYIRNRKQTQDFLDDKTLKSEKQDRKALLKQSNLYSDQTYNKILDNLEDEHGEIKNKHDMFKVGLLGLFSSKFQSSQVAVSTKQKQIEQTAIKKQEIKQNLRLQKLYEALERLNEEEKYKKAVRHFYDAFNYQSIRHDIETEKRKFVNFCYSVQNSKLWGVWLMLIIWFFLVITFFEPDTRFDKFDEESDYTQLVLIGEGCCVAFIFLDLVMQIYHQYFDDTQTMMQKFFGNFKFQCKFWFSIICILDLVFMYALYPENSLRFSRFVRWIGIILYSRSMRKVFQGICFSVQKLMIFILFFLFFMTFWAFCGVKIIGELDGEIPYTDQLNNFSEVMPTITILYSLVTIDLYPESMITALNSSYFYLFYFLPYLILTMMLLIPIPVAVVFEAFKKNQINLIIEDRLKQRSALFCCFVTLDFNDQKYMTTETFKKLMHIVYKNKLSEEAINDLYLEIDENNSQKVSIDEFFLLIDIIEENYKYDPTQKMDFPFFKKIKDFANKKLKLRAILNSATFSIVIFIITTVDVILIFIGMFSSDEQLAESIDQIDIAFLIVYSVEAFLKIISLGIQTYFSDSWNTFDFVLICASLFFQIFILQKNLPIGLIRTASRITRYRKIFRLTKALRSVKFINFFFIGFQLFTEVKEMISKITLTVPIFFRLLSILVGILFFFSSIGVELFTIKNNMFDSFSELKPFKKEYCSTEDLKTVGFFNWGSCEYANLDTFWGNYLLLVQVLTGSGWSYLIYEGSKRLKSLFWSFMFFDTFHLLCQLVIASLLKGIIWEIFSVVDTTFEEDIEEEDLEGGNSKKKNLDHQRSNMHELELLQGDIMQYNRDTVMTDDITRIKMSNVKGSNNIILNTEISNFNEEKNLLTNSNNLLETKNNGNSNQFPTLQNEDDVIEDGKKGIDISDINISINGRQNMSVMSMKNYNNKYNNKRNNQVPLDFTKISIANDSLHLSSIRPGGSSGRNADKEKSISSNNTSICLKFLKSQSNSLQRQQTISRGNQLLVNDSRMSDMIIDQQDLQIFDMGENLFEHIDFKKVFQQSMQLEEQYNIVENMEGKPNNNNHSDSSFEVNLPHTNRNNQLQNSNFNAGGRKYFQQQNNKSRSQSRRGSSLNLNQMQLRQQQQNDNKVQVEYVGFKEADMTVNQTLLIQNQSGAATPSNNNNLQLLREISDKNQNSQNNGVRELQLSGSKFSMAVQSYEKSQQQIQLQQVSPSLQNQQKKLRPIERFRQVVLRVKRELINKEMFYFRSKFMTYLQFSAEIMLRKQRGEIKEFDEEEHVFQTEDEECISTFIRVVYDDMVQNEENRVKNKRKSLVQDLYTPRSLMNKAMLGGTDKKMMKELESNYFSKMYGNIYKEMRETEVLPMINIQSKLTSNLNTTLKFQSVPIKIFFKILDGFEKKVTHSLLSKGSFCKFIYQTVNNVWFSLTFKKDKIKFVRIREGFWKFHETLFRQQQEQEYNRNMEEDGVWIGKSVLEGYQKSLSFEMQYFIQELKQMAHTLQGDSSLIQERDKYFDIVMCNVGGVNMRQIQNKLIQMDYKNLDQNTVYDGKNFQQQQGLESDSTLQYEIVKNSIIKNVQFFVLNNKNINRQQQVPRGSRMDGMKKSQLNTNYEARRFISDFGRQQSNISSQHLDPEYNNNLKSASNEIMTFAYVVELVKDVKKILESHKSNLLLKASEVFFERYKLEISNFLDINYNKIWEEQEEQEEDNNNNNGQNNSLVINDTVIEQYCVSVERQNKRQEQLEELQLQKQIMEQEKNQQSQQRKNKGRKQSLFEQNQQGLKGILESNRGKKNQSRFESSPNLLKNLGVGAGDMTSRSNQRKKIN